MQLAPFHSHIVRNLTIIPANDDIPEERMTPSIEQDGIHKQDRRGLWHQGCGNRYEAIRAVAGSGHGLYCSCHHGRHWRLGHRSKRSSNRGIDLDRRNVRPRSLDDWTLAAETRRTSTMDHPYPSLDCDGAVRLGGGCAWPIRGMADHVVRRRPLALAQPAMVRFPDVGGDCMHDDHMAVASCRPPTCDTQRRG